VDELAAVVAAARRVGAVVASDECYALLGWDEPWAGGAPSVLDPRVTGGSHGGVLAAYSLSKQSNLAGYRAAFVAGDPALVAGLLQARKHIGMMVPGPVQAAMVAALDDDAHVAEQRSRYGRRRAALRAAFAEAGYVVEASPAGLYLWLRAPGQDGWATVADLAGQGILVAPGSFYGAAGVQHVRVALTATDDAVVRAVARLAGA
jgi:aspartate/methionine/tyrosine aminotransferase